MAVRLANELPPGDRGTFFDKRQLCGAIFVHWTLNIICTYSNEGVDWLLQRAVEPVQRTMGICSVVDERNMRHSKVGKFLTRVTWLDLDEK